MSEDYPRRRSDGPPSMPPTPPGRPTPPMPPTAPAPSSLPLRSTPPKSPTPPMPGRRRAAPTASRRGGSVGRSGRGGGRGRLAGLVLLVCVAVVVGVVMTHSSSGGGSPQGLAATDGTASPTSTAVSAVAGGAGPGAASSSAGASGPSSPSSSRSSGTPTKAAATSKASTGSHPAVAGKRTMTLVNHLNQTIWPAIAADPNHPVEATGWVLAPGASLTFAIPDHWDVRLWARVGCTFNSAGKGDCLSGGCGSFQCGRTWGQFPSTLAEFNLNAWNGMDFYDVSLVEGNNLPMWINSSGGSSQDKVNANGCSPAGCTRDANATCPSVMQRVRDGRVVACLSACLVYKTDQTCCTGAYAPRAKCVPSSWPTDSAAVFKKAEPFAYSYVNDDATSVLTCSGECDYRVTWGVSP